MVQKMTNVPEIFGSMVFSDAVMKKRLPQDTYERLQRTMKDGKKLDISIANEVAAAMKDWAVEKGATHFTHWFQPLTGVTAEKHDSFISPTGDGGVMMVFSGKELVKGESDASSLPSGGLRATFEARGYTAWDPNSYAFIKDNTLYIPTAFCSWGGEALDTKTPLLRSMEALDRQAVRVLKLFGNSEVCHVLPTVGPEQEYFLVDRTVYEKRPDLVITGRTLFGAKPPKGQELDDHYYGTIKPRVAAFMAETDEELWKLGIPDKTRHNESAPAQHELAPIFSTANIAADYNQLTMETVKKVARRHDLVCLLHEKPFEGVNGSGKHNNWSLTTDTGENLFEPGDTPYLNARFLLFLCAVIKAVDEYPEMLRISVASAGNDRRLGASEAPPAVISIFLGDELSEILDALEAEKPYSAREKTVMKVGVHTLPRFPKDSTDRNRTSPFAFTGNKFEFRSLGSSASISDTNTVLNTAVAEELRQFADVLEKAEDFNDALHTLICSVIREHKRILFNGNGYDEAWKAEAAARGLIDLPTTPDALSHMLDDKNVALFERHGVFSKAEMEGRYEILIGNYAKIIRIEAETMLRMARQEILPAVIRCKKETAEALSAVLGADAVLDVTPEKELLSRMCELAARLNRSIASLAEAMRQAAAGSCITARAGCYKEAVIPAMNELRSAADQLELICDSTKWPYPSYSQLLFSVT